MKLSNELFPENNNEKDKNTTKRLSKHECYRAIKGNNIKLRIWYKYHMAEMKRFSALFNFNWLYGP